MVIKNWAWTEYIYYRNKHPPLRLSRLFASGQLQSLNHAEHVKRVPQIFFGDILV